MNFPVIMNAAAVRQPIKGCKELEADVEVSKTGGGLSPKLVGNPPKVGLLEFKTDGGVLVLKCIRFHGLLSNIVRSYKTQFADIRIILYLGGVPDGDAVVGGVGVPETGDDVVGGGGVAETEDDVVGGGGVAETGDTVVGGDEEEDDVGKMQDPTPICKSIMGKQLALEVLSDHFI